MNHPAGPGRPSVGFKRHLAHAVVPGDATYVVSENGVTALQGAQLAELAPLLDGSRDLVALLSELGGRVSPAQLGAILGQLTRAKLLGQFTSPVPDDLSEASAEAYWESADLVGSEAGKLVSTARVRVRAVGTVDTSATEAACRAVGLTVLPGHDDAADITVVLCSSYLDPALLAVDREHRAAGLPWLPAKPTGVQVWSGPVFRPGDFACWQCLAHRLRERYLPQLHVETALGLLSPLTPPPAAVPASSGTAAQLVALEVAKWAAGHRYPGQSAIHTLDTLTLESRHHPVGRRPQCPGCGDPGLMAAQVRRPFALSPRPKSADTGAGHRALAPAETLDRYQHLVGGLTGVVNAIRRDRRGPEFLNCFLSGHNPALGARGLRELTSGVRSLCAGKGRTELEARVGALCEALERYSGLHQGDEPRTRDSLAALGADAVHPDLVQLYHPRQFLGRHEWNAVQPTFQQVPDPFDEQAPVDWTPVWSISAQRQRLLPTALLYFGVPQPAGQNFVLANSNGCAAGSSLEDAVLQGLMELVERDAIALWWYNRTRQPAVDTAAFGDPWIEQVRGHHASLNRELWALDLTADLGIPVYAALSRRTDKPQQDIMFGFGAHLDPRLALRRAVAELNQLLPTVVDAAPDGTGYATGDRSLLDWCRTATTAGHPYLLPDPLRPAGGPTDHPCLAGDDLGQDVLVAERLLAAQGLELLVLDQTRADIGLPVVRVLVPGLRHFWARFGPGRLYDVPVALGRLSEPTNYQQLNPVPLFF